MKYIGVILGIILAVALGVLLDDIKFGATPLIRFMGGLSLGALLPVIGYAAGKIISR